MTEYRRAMNDYYYDTYGQISKSDNHIGVYDSALNSTQFMDVWIDTFQAMI